MKRQLIVDVSCGFVRSALLEEGVPAELRAWDEAEADSVGDIYAGRILRNVPSLNAAFADIGTGRQVFVSLEAGERVRQGDMVPLQLVKKPASPEKGWQMRLRLQLPGEMLVLCAGKPGIAISRKITSAARRQELVSLLEGACPPSDGLIVRTAAQDADPGQLLGELETLSSRLAQLLQRAAHAVRPCRLEGRGRPVLDYVRETCRREETALVTNQEDLAGELKCMLACGLLHPGCTVEHVPEDLLFDAYGLETALEHALERVSWLPCGAYLVLDRCEAGTLVDVNSGHCTGTRQDPSRILLINLEAAERVLSLARLCNLGGMILVDLIDMDSPGDRQTLLSRVRAQALLDPAGVTVEDITRLGILEMTRTRAEGELSEAFLEREAPRRRRTARTHAAALWRELRRKEKSGQREAGVLCSRDVLLALGRLSAPGTLRVRARVQEGPPRVTGSLEAAWPPVWPAPPNN